ncbi:hypothetical protein PsYK624_081360 [Phanerochaete sordida]|uniref:Uncharacterized protein n=1 Tax=Phanerochaete sordida TaxID=48140 RepID=A0A9P3G9Q3_9APHY|nr:hypothetical protein PsYK624_081360 [Phanerochaete sordida]
MSVNRRTTPHTRQSMKMTIPFNLDFNHSVVTYQSSNGVYTTVGTDALINGGVGGLENATYLDLTLHTGAPDIAGVARLDLARMPGVRTLKINVAYETQDDNRGVLDVWKSILALVRSIPDTLPLCRLVLCSPVTREMLRSGWARAPFGHALGRVTWNIDARLVRLVDGTAPVDTVVLVPPRGENFTADEWHRTTSLFPALRDYGMLEF